jgi:hypothetical protein
MTLHELAMAYMMTDYYTNYDLSLIGLGARAANAKEEDFNKWLSNLRT